MKPRSGIKGFEEVKYYEGRSQDGDEAGNSSRTDSIWDGCFIDRRSNDRLASGSQRELEERDAG